jgi:hypothetical protein
MAIQHEAMSNVFDRLVQTQRDAEASLVKLPAVIEGQITTDSEPTITEADERERRQAQYRQIRDDPNRLNALIDSESARFPDLLPSRVPRTVVDYLVRMERESNA